MYNMLKPSVNVGEGMNGSSPRGNNKEGEEENKS